MTETVNETPKEATQPELFDKDGNPSLEVLSARILSRLDPKEPEKIKKQNERIADEADERRRTGGSN